MARSKTPPIRCCVCKKEMRVIIEGKALVLTEKSPWLKPHGWQKRKTGEWLCPDFICHNLFFSRKRDTAD